MASGDVADQQRERMRTLKQIVESGTVRIKHLEEAIANAESHRKDLEIRFANAKEDRTKEEEALEGLVRESEERGVEVDTLQKELQDLEARIKAKNDSLSTLREATRKEEIRAKVGQEMQRLRREEAADVARSSRQLSLAAALRIINQRIKVLEDEEPLRAAEMDQLDKDLLKETEEFSLLHGETQRAMATEDDKVRSLKREIETVGNAIERTREETKDIEEENERLRQEPELLESRKAELQEKIEHLNDSIAAIQRDRRSIEEDKNSVAQRIVRSESSGERMGEVMMLIKAAVINLHRDYTTIVQLRERILRRTDDQAVFKEAFSSIKTALRIDARLPPSKCWTRDGAALTEKDVGFRGKGQPLQGNELRAVFKALQEMAVAWDVAPSRHSSNPAFNTSEEILANAMLLYALARNTLEELNRNVIDKRNSLSVAERRVQNLYKSSPARHT